ncbi:MULTISPECIES: hypothetical protein [unclassified Methylobacterium]|uniref:hypothetical protein n=1 Tax=unclassified Methylobacterium TaxID=2615210 RepID=UPI00226A2D78|nr:MULTISPECIES: hypothetical protein [unclassified Methylobacterium]
MSHAYTIRAKRGRETKQLLCASAWVAFERHRLLIRQGWSAFTFGPAGESVTDSRLEVLAQAEVSAAVSGENSD